MPWSKRKRTYTDVGTAAVAGGFAVQLDGRPLTTPQGRPLTLASRALAATVAGEWAEQGDRLRPETMPITRLACAVVDRLGQGREQVVARVVGYGDTDLLCYRAEGPSGLAARQRAAWGPLLEWAAAAIGARLTVTAGVAPIEQPPAARAALRRAVEALDDGRLAALAAAVEASGSLIVGLALIMGRIDAARAVEASQIDEAWQREQWGNDADAAARRRALADEIAATARYLDLIGR